MYNNDKTRDYTNPSLPTGDPGMDALGHTNSLSLQQSTFAALCDKLDEELHNGFVDPSASPKMRESIKLESNKQKKRKHRMKETSQRRICMLDEGFTLIKDDISYNPSKEIGRGSHGIVFLGRFDEKEVAVKRVEKQMHPGYMKEVYALRNIQEHRHILLYKKTVEDDNFCYIITELCRGNLNELETGQFDPCDVFAQIMKGIEHLHRENFIHRDLKPKNILYNIVNNKVTVKIADFKHCKSSSGGSVLMSSSARGTEGWRAPEMRKENQINKKADIFSCGCIFHWLLTGQTPGGVLGEIEQNVQRGQHDLSYSNLTPNQKHLIESMIADTAAARPSSSAVLNHPTFWGENKTKFFLMECAQMFEKEKIQHLHCFPRDKPYNAPFVKKLEKSWKKSSFSIVGGVDWTLKMKSSDRKTWKYLNGELYNGHLLNEIVRAIRNTICHPTKKVKLADFTQMFPSLVLFLFLEFEDLKKSHHQFQKYYDQDFDWRKRKTYQ